MCRHQELGAEYNAPGVRMKVRIFARLFFVESLLGLSRHKLRTGLAALGTTVGVVSVILVVAIGQAGTAQARAQMAELGDNLVWVEAGSRNVNGVRTGTHGTTSLTPADAEAIRGEVALVKAVAENVDGTAQVVYGHRNWNVRWRGVSPEYFEVKRWQLAGGSFFTGAHVRAADNVLVIGDTARHELFGDASPIGQVVRVQTAVFRVIGLLVPRGQSTTGQDQDDVIMMPWTTAQKKLKGRGYEWLDDILCSAISPEAVDDAVQAIAALMRQRHHIAGGAPDDFNMRRPDDVINAQIAASRTLAALLVLMASITLVVGGIGIMNIMLASVAERAPEIGIRMAVGATPAAVQAQFLGEAALLSLLGGLLGLCLSVAALSPVESLLEWKLSMPPEAALIAVSLSVAEGALFGFYPAWRAARLDPIAAIRNE